MLDEEQYRASVAAEVGALNRRLYLLGVDEAELPEALDEVVHVLVASRSAFTGAITFSMFCFGVAARVVGRWRRPRGARTDGKTHTPELPQGEGTFAGITVAALDRLPYRHRIVLVAVEMQGMSVEELVHVLNLPSHAGPMLEARLQRARVLFANALRELETNRHSPTLA